MRRRTSSSSPTRRRLLAGVSLEYTSIGPREARVNLAAPAEGTKAVAAIRAKQNKPAARRRPGHRTTLFIEKFVARAKESFPALTGKPKAANASPLTRTPASPTTPPRQMFVLRTSVAQHPQREPTPLFALRTIAWNALATSRRVTWGIGADRLRLSVGSLPRTLQGELNSLGDSISSPPGRFRAGIGCRRPP